MVSNCGGSGWVHVTEARMSYGYVTRDERAGHARCPGCTHEECPYRVVEKFDTSEAERDAFEEVMWNTPERWRSIQRGRLAAYRDRILQEERDRVRPILEAVAIPVWGLDNADWVPGVVRPHLKKLNDIQAAVAEYRKQVDG